jgi:hypothetical protein
MRITVEVKSQSHEEGVEKVDEGHYIVRVKEPSSSSSRSVSVSRSSLYQEPHQPPKSSRSWSVTFKPFAKNRFTWRR